MAENKAKYDLILQNSGSKQEYVVRGLENVSKNPLYYEFPDFHMPEDAPEGEYLYVLLYNIRNDVEYTFKDDIFATILHTNDGDVELRYLDYETGVMKYGTEVGMRNNYRVQNKNFIYRKK